MRYILRYSILFYLFILLPFAGYAQNAEERYRAIYDQAEHDYNIGRLDEARQSLKEHLKDFPITLRTSAYRILSLCCIGQDDEWDSKVIVDAKEMREATARVMRRNLIPADRSDGLRKK